jgi:RNA polymerase sigma factor (sigma-70 family)
MKEVVINEKVTEVAGDLAKLSCSPSIFDAVLGSVSAELKTSLRKIQFEIFKIIQNFIKGGDINGVYNCTITQTTTNSAKRIHAYHRKKSVTPLLIRSVLIFTNRITLARSRNIVNLIRITEPIPSSFSFLQKGVDTFAYIVRRVSMPNFIPRFYEILLDNDELDKLSYECLFSYQNQEDPKKQLHRASARKEILNLVFEIIESELTQRQRDCIKLYFLQEKTQAEVAEILGISRRVVSQHIYGIRRDGKRVGGAIKKIRKVCKKRGIGIKRITSNQDAGDYN